MTKCSLVTINPMPLGAAAMPRHASPSWTNALAVNMKATKAFGHDIRPRLLEHST
jgi:hypothetical protein